MPTRVGRPAVGGGGSGRSTLLRMAAQQGAVDQAMEFPDQHFSFGTRWIHVSHLEDGARR